MRRFTTTLLLIGLVASCVMPVEAKPQVVPPPMASLRVVSDPTGALVYVDRHNRGSTPLDLEDLTPGKHLIEVQKERYQTLRQTVTLEPTKRTTVENKLKRTKGLLLVKTTPEGASVKVNGIDRGQGPVMITDLVTGSYRVSISSAGYISKEIQVKLPDRRPRMVDISLLSDFGKLVISSSPTGAEVTLNGVSRGTTPVTVDRIPTGESTLEIFADGYRRYQESVRLTAGETQQLDCGLEPIPASLRIVTIPLNARVYVNNQFEGEAPVLLKGLPPGEYRVRAEQPNYDTVARTITLNRADRVVEEFRLKANVGAVKITTEPAGVEVLIDGAYEALTDSSEDQTDNVSEVLTLQNVRSGKRKFSFVHKDYFTHDEDVDVTRDDTVAIHVKMERRFIPNLEVRTHAAVYKGVYQGLDVNGDIKLEIRPGITKSFSQREVISSRPIKQATLPDTTTHPDTH